MAVILHFIRTVAVILHFILTGYPAFRGACFGSRCGCFLLAAMVILIRIYAFYFGSPRRINYITFIALRFFTYLYGTRWGWRLIQTASGGGCGQNGFPQRRFHPASWSLER